VKIFSKLLVGTLGNCGSQTEWTMHVGRRYHRGRLIAIANERQRCMCTGVYTSPKYFSSIHVLRVLFSEKYLPV